MSSLLQSGRLLLAAAVLSVSAPFFEPSAVLAQPPGMPSANAPVGLSVNDARAYQGYTLLYPMNSTSTYLIDMEGRVVNTWKSDYTPGMSAYLLENGHLLRAGSQPGGSMGGAGNGGRLQKFAWDGELLWDFLLSTDRNHPHHDICPMPNGNVLVIAWDKKTPEEAIAAGRRPETVRGQFLPDCILEVRPTGKTTGEIVWQWHAWDHLIQDVDKTKPHYGEISEHPELIDINYGTGVMAAMLNDPKELAKLRSLGYVGGGTADAGVPGPDRRGPDAADRGAPGTDRGAPGADRGAPGADRRGPGPRGGGPPMSPDWMHTNSVAYNAELDQIMLSIHEFSEIWIIDHSTTTVEAASHAGGRCGAGGDLLYRWGNPRAYRNGTNADQRLFAQHSAHWIAKGLPGAGHVLVFNNGNGRPDGMYSSVDEIVTPLNKNGRYTREEFLAFGPDRAAWSYSAPDKGSFFSMNISSAQRLPNGNTLICSGAAGVLFEVTADRDTVWKYSFPNRGPGGFGGPGGPGGPGGMRPGELFPSFLQDMLQLTEEQRAKLAELQKKVDSQIAEILTKEQKTRLDDMQRGFAGGPGFGPPGFGPPGFVPGGFGPPRDDADGPDSSSRPDGSPRPDGTPRPDATPRPNGIPRADGAPRPDGPGGTSDRDAPRGLGGPAWAGFDGQDGGPDGRPGGRRGGPGGGPGGPGGGPGGLFTSYRYGADYPGLVGKVLTPGEKLEDLMAKQDASPRPSEPQGR